MVLDTKQVIFSSVRIIEDYQLFLRKSQVVKIQPIVDFITRVEVVSVGSALSQASSVCLIPGWKKGERWSEAREISA